MREIISNPTVVVRPVVFNGQEFDLVALESSLRKSSLVEDCVVLARKAADGAVELAAYVVPTLPYSSDRLEAQVKSVMPSETGCFCVPVSAIPLTESGAVDEKALTELPVVDKELLQRWEKQLESLLGRSMALFDGLSEYTSEKPAQTLACRCLCMEACLVVG